MASAKAGRRQADASAPAPSSPARTVAFFGHDWTESTVVKRVRAFQAHGTRVIGFMFSFVNQQGWKASLIGIVVGGGVLYLIAEGYYRIRHEEGLGMGDVKMLGMIGAFLGWKLALVTLVLASLLGSVVGIGLLVLKKESMKYALPFGTFLAIGALTAATVGDAMLQWYLGFYS